jgi:hemerythrin
MFVGIEQIHTQHETLERLFQQIAEASESTEAEVPVHTIVEELVRALRVHFRDEEEFMEAIGYPELAGHRWQHATLLGDAEGLESGLHRGTTTLAEAARLLRFIVADHVADTDSEMFRYFESRRGDRTPG